MPLCQDLRDAQRYVARDSEAGALRFVSRGCLGLGRRCAGTRPCGQEIEAPSHVVSKGMAQHGDSVDVEILPGHDLSVVAALDLCNQFLLAGAPEELVVEDQQPWPSLGGDLRQFPG